MQRIEVNVKTGEQKMVDLTPEEIAQAQANTIAEAEERADFVPQPTIADLQAQIDQLKGIPSIATALQAVQPSQKAAFDSAVASQKPNLA